MTCKQPADVNLAELQVQPVERTEEARYQDLLEAHYYWGGLPKIG